MTRRALVLLAACLGALVLSGCIAPAPPPEDPKVTAAAAFYPDSAAAIDFAFGRFGPGVVSCARRYATRESGMWPLADNGTHHGMFQMHDGYWGSILAAQQTLGHLAPSWYNAWQNAYAASIGYSQSGWSPWAPRLAGC